MVIIREHSQILRPLCNFYQFEIPKKYTLHYRSLTMRTYFERVSIFVILLNCVTLGLYDPFDPECSSQKCQTLDTMEKIIYAFFLVEMLCKWMAMGLFGKMSYFADPWNRLDCFIVAAGWELTGITFFSYCKSTLQLKSSSNYAIAIATCLVIGSHTSFSTNEKQNQSHLVRARFFLRFEEVSGNF